MLRCFDVLISCLAFLILWPVLLLLFVFGLFDTGAPIFSQQRVGRNKKAFVLYKFRTMAIDTKDVATHLACSSSVTSFGRFLRKTKLDELPQLWNVLKGDMSIVGPRPCLLSQTELISAREVQGVFAVRPGITGLAQVNGIDMSTPVVLAEKDAEMLHNLTTVNYFRYIIMTILGKGSGDCINNS